MHPPKIFAAKKFQIPKNRMYTFFPKKLLSIFSIFFVGGLVIFKSFLMQPIKNLAEKIILFQVLKSPNYFFLPKNDKVFCLFFRVHSTYT